MMASTGGGTTIEVDFENTAKDIHSECYGRERTTGTDQVLCRQCTPDEDAEHICDAAQNKQHKHEQGQSFCGSSCEVLIQLGQSGPQVGYCHHPPQSLPYVHPFACSTKTATQRRLSLSVLGGRRGVGGGGFTTAGMIVLPV